MSCQQHSSRRLSQSEKNSKTISYLMQGEAIYICLLITFNFIQGHGQPIIGNQKNCQVEGEEVEIPGITADPCISCFCQNGFVQCRTVTCPSLDCQVTTKEKGSCCRECQGCTVNDRIYRSSQEWSAYKFPKCIASNCQNGIVTRLQIQCSVTCARPLPPPPGNCCPSCYEGCSTGGKTFYEGQTFTLSTDNCTTCECKNRRISCFKIPCPVLSCAKGRSQLRKDGCCLECVDIEIISSPGKEKCWFRGKSIPAGKKIKPDACSKCICQRGTMICKRNSCPAIRNCKEVDLVYKPNRCCPMCPDDVFLDCTEQNGGNYKHGEKWTDVRDPCRSCRCNNGTVTCTEITCSNIQKNCRKGEVLDSVPGKCCKVCVPEPGICTVFGDPHYRTFDGRPFNFQGDCKYILSKDCREKNFSITVQNDGKRSRSFSWTKTVFLYLYKSDRIPETTITLHQRLAVKLNGRKVYPPVRNPYYNIQITRGYVEVKTIASISLRWDGDSYLEVAASPIYGGLLCGLCGNFNGFVRDDFIGGDGTFKWNDVSYAESWKASTNIFDCTRPNYDIALGRPCGSKIKSLAVAREKCSIFKSRSFHPCYRTIDPVEYYDSCLMDACECPRNRKCACESIRAYTEACSREGIGITWNERDYCKRMCKHGKVYSSCGPPCKLTCKNYENSKRNKHCLRLPCIAGCHCPAGQILYKKRCIKVSKCPKKKPLSCVNKNDTTFLNPGWMSVEA